MLYLGIVYFDYFIYLINCCLYMLALLPSKVIISFPIFVIRLVVLVLLLVIILLSLLFVLLLVLLLF